MAERKPKVAEFGRNAVYESPRRSLFDILQTNIKLGKRISFLHRLIYVGEHNAEIDEYIEKMRENVTDSNSGFCTEPLTGILLCYKNHFCHMVEGSEEILNKHLTLLFKENNENLSKLKLLSVIHHIKARFCNEWLSYYGRPSERVEEIDLESDLEASMDYVKECCLKMFAFATAFVADQKKIKNDEEFGKAISSKKLPPKRGKSSFVTRDLYVNHLPEIKLLKFLLGSKHVIALKNYQHFYGYIGESSGFSNKQWPAPRNLVPFNVFETPYNPIQNLPIESSETVKNTLLANSANVETKD